MAPSPSRRRGADTQTFRNPLRQVGATSLTPHETALVTTLLDRLKTTVVQPKDVDAEALIRQATAEQPDATYYLAQTVLIHDLSLYSAKNRIAELEKNLAEAKIAASPLPTSFLGELLNTDQPPSRAAEPPARNAAAPLSPALTSQRGELALPAPNAQTVSGTGTGDFLRAAAVTAASTTQRDDSNHENRADRSAI